MAKPGEGTTKPLAAYPKQMLKPVYLIAYDRTDPELTFYGSASNPDMQFPSDLDAMEKVTVHGTKRQAAKQLVKGFQDMVKRVRATKEMYLGELKCGSDPLFDIDIGKLDGGKIVGYDAAAIQATIIRLHKGEYVTDIGIREIGKLLPGKISLRKWLELQHVIHGMKTIRWTPDEVLAGKKELHDGSYTDLSATVLDGSLCKFDIVGVVGGRLLEESNMYEISLGKSVKFDVKDTAYLDGLRGEIVKWALGPNVNLIKACKRISSLSKVTGDKALYDKMPELFNGQLGALGQIVADIKVIVWMLNEYNDMLPWATIITELDMLKFRFSVLPDLDIDELKIYTTLNQMASMRNTSLNRKRMNRGLCKMTDELMKVLNSGTAKWMIGQKLYPLPAKFFP